MTEEKVEVGSKYEDSIDEISALIRARVPIIWVLTHEENRFIEEFRSRVAKPGNRQLWVWSRCQGLVKCKGELGIQPASGDEAGTNVIKNALERITTINKTKDEEGVCFIMRDMHSVLNQETTRRLRDIYEHISGHAKTVIIVSPVLAHGPDGTKQGIPSTLEKEISVVGYELPEVGAIQKRITAVLKQMRKVHKSKKDIKLDYTEEEILSFAKALRGLTRLEIDNAVCTSMTYLKGMNIKKLVAEKKQIIAKSDILEFVETDIELDDVGGLDLAKAYLEKYASAQSEEAKEFGVEPLKGIILSGIPGTGKSLFSKVIGRMWNLPLLRLDVGRVMGSLVGQSIRGSEEIVWYDKNHKSHRDTIKELVDSKPSDCFVQTYDDYGQVSLGRVVEFIAHPVKETTKLYRLNLENGRSIVCTGDHGVFSNTDMLELETVRVDSLTNGDFIAVPKRMQTKLTTERSFKENWFDGFLAGSWLGDGDYNQNDIRLHLNIKDVEPFSNVFKEFNVSHSVYKSSSPSEGKVVHIKDNLRSKLEKQGFVGKSKTKRVPAFVFGMNQSYISGLLCGYFSTDGSFSNHVLEVSSVSKELRDDIVHLLHMFGIHAFVTQKLNTNGYPTDNEYKYVINISSMEDLSIFREEIGFLQDYKQDKIQNYNSQMSHGEYIPLTESMKKELKAIRRFMWTKTKDRQMNFRRNNQTIGIHTIQKFLRFAPTQKEIKQNNLSEEFYCKTLRQAIGQDIRWIKVKNIEEVKISHDEQYVYDISVPDKGTEKFVVGSCPILVHNSESRMREVVQVLKSMRPAICWIDEVEKSLSGTKSSGFTDGGTLSRVFGTLLHAMQEELEGITLIATSNDISALPPEFIRRFNDVFFVDLPGPDERWEIFSIHLRKRGRDITKFNKYKQQLLDASLDYTGAEIEKAIKDAIAAAFHGGYKDVNHKDIVVALKDTKPISKVMKDKINKIREKARGHYRYASSWAESESKDRKVKSKSGKSININEALDDMPEIIKTKREKQNQELEERTDRFSSIAKGN